MLTLKPFMYIVMILFVLSSSLDFYLMIQRIIIDMRD
ncbi:unnamed protein product [Spirodela intermedia]|uniref:Uncharacterized protein n=2 Tax=Spirodela intermedia TaxID=51605 RepID=A0A7I8KMZ0_SPIIN|nr:unnamed protein product [Spirodela intermedia]